MLYFPTQQTALYLHTKSKGLVCGVLHSHIFKEAGVYNPAR